MPTLSTLSARLALASLVAAIELGAPAAPNTAGPSEPAAARPQPGGAWIQLELVGDSPLAEDTLADLRALLERDGIGVELEPVDTSAGPGAGPLAVIRVEFRPGAAVSVSVDIRDAVTNKRIGRDLDLESVPWDGRSLMIAATADELLDASWAEIILGHWQSRAEEEPVPELVSEIVERELEPPEARPPEARPPRLAHRAAAGPVGAWTSGGLGALGAAVSYELRVLGRVGVELGGRGFGVLAPRLRSGRVVGGGGLGSLGLVLATRAPRAALAAARFELDLGAHVAAGGLSLTGITTATQTRRRAAAPLVELGGTLTPSVLAGRRVRLELPISVAGLVRGVVVRDLDGPVSAMSGVSIGLGLRVAWVSWPG